MAISSKTFTTIRDTDPRLDTRILQVRRVIDIHAGAKKDAEDYALGMALSEVIDMADRQMPACTGCSHRKAQKEESLNHMSGLKELRIMLRCDIGACNKRETVVMEPATVNAYGNPYSEDLVSAYNDYKGQRKAASRVEDKDKPKTDLDTW